MKRTLLILLSLTVGIAVIAQQNYRLDKSQKEYNVKLVYTAPIDDPLNFEQTYNPTVRSSSAAPEETIIGGTRYDLQTNTMVQGRIYMHDDGTIGAVWTRGMVETSFTDRGTGYNYFDGGSWGDPPTERIESLKCGWPNYAAWGPNGEMVISHNGTIGLQISKREDKGFGDWIEDLYQGPAGIEESPTWPRFATGGEENDVVHLIYNSYDPYNDQTAALLYSRSVDGGENWEIKDMVFDDLGPDYYSEVGADSYAIVAKGDDVAILVCDTWVNDLVMLKSADGGTTWDKTIIWEHPYPFYDWDVTVTDTFFAPDGAATITLGPDGKAHVVFTLCRVLHDVVGTSYTLWPYADGVVYWNEDMPPFTPGRNTLATPTFDYNYSESELVEDYNLIGWMPDTDGNGSLDIIGEFLYYRTIGSTTWPTLTVDDNNNVFVAYSTLDEAYDNFTYNFRHIWSRAYANGQWGPMMDLTSDIIHIFDECIYPVLSPTSNDMIHLIYSTDQLIGLALDEDHEYVDNTIIYAGVPKDDLLTSIGEQAELISDNNVSQNYPNPFTGLTNIYVNLDNAAPLSLEVTNLIGQQVVRIDKGNVTPGVYQFQVDGSDLKDGIYFYTVRAGNSAVTKKMIVR